MPIYDNRLQTMRLGFECLHRPRYVGDIGAGVGGGLVLGVAIGVAAQQWSKRGSDN